MKDYEKQICEEVLRDGKVVKDEQFTCEGDACRQYTVEYLGESYNMTQINGEWVYFHHNF